MINFLRNKRFVVILLTLVLTFSWVFISLAADPGSTGDPLISLSYFESKIKDLQEEVTNNITQTLTKKFNELELSINNSIKDIKDKGVTPSSSFEVVTLKENESLICDGGTEIIVRSGKCSIVASTTGGISDVTAGKDLINGEQITANHLLIVPRSDGRGITATVTGAVMVKGTYKKQ